MRIVCASSWKWNGTPIFPLLAVLNHPATPTRGRRGTGLPPHALPPCGSPCVAAPAGQHAVAVAIAKSATPCPRPEEQCRKNDRWTPGFPGVTSRYAPSRQRRLSTSSGGTARRLRTGHSKSAPANSGAPHPSLPRTRSGCRSRPASISPERRPPARSCASGNP